MAEGCADALPHRQPDSALVAARSARFSAALGQLPHAVLRLTLGRAAGGHLVVLLLRASTGRSSLRAAWRRKMSRLIALASSIAAWVAGHADGVRKIRLYKIDRL